MSYVVFYLERDSLSASESGDEAPFNPKCICFGDNELIPAMEKINTLRARENVCHVVISTDAPNMVGKLGVDSIVDGKTPDGHVYDWSKQDRAGKMRKKDLNKVPVREV